jgi:hypothetical protein
MSETRRWTISKGRDHRGHPYSEIQGPETAEREVVDASLLNEALEAMEGDWLPAKALRETAQRIRQQLSPDEHGESAQERMAQAVADAVAQMGGLGASPAAAELGAAWRQLSPGRKEQRID